ncbi:class F sortase [Streptomyces sp. DSM 42041]|uniref:Class F sortase n=1 Tax=Streptomyces hazeniae TaxID=3075538 RepID=A0ABU2NN01_9ACTN|nr:class F sortase [Streptomyces sp. DSM 42041]MDT0378331.1 class F sortase [Streptomyces sp. DSM 42041]
MRRRLPPVRAALAAAVLCTVAAVALVLLPGGGPPPDFGTRATGDTRSSGAPAPAPHSTPPSASGAGRPGTDALPAGPPAEPTGIRIDRVGLAARVEPVGVLENGTVEVPTSPDSAGWYRFGVAPGEVRGSAVLVGHVDHATGELGEFAALYDVRAGDEVSIRRDGAEPARYRITAREVVDQERLPSGLFRREGLPVLTLITCAPPYDEGSGYRNNLVVTAEPRQRA